MIISEVRELGKISRFSGLDDLFKVEIDIEKNKVIFTFYNRSTKIETIENFIQYFIMDNEKRNYKYFEGLRK